MANKGVLDLQAWVDCKEHKKAVTDEMSSTKVTSFSTASTSKSDDAVLAAEGKFAFHTMKHHSGYKTVDCTSVLFFIIYSVFCLTTGPKPLPKRFLHVVRNKFLVNF